MLGGGTYRADIWAFVKDILVLIAPAVLEVAYRPEVHSCFVAMRHLWLLGLRLRPVPWTWISSGPNKAIEHTRPACPAHNHLG